MLERRVPANGRRDSAAGEMLWRGTQGSVNGAGGSGRWLVEAGTGILSVIDI